jgi:hypothetical protein
MPTTVTGKPAIAANPEAAVAILYKARDGLPWDRVGRTASVLNEFSTIEPGKTTPRPDPQQTVTRLKHTAN